MDLVVKHTSSQNIVVRPQGRPTWYPAATVDPATVQVWWRAINPDNSRGVWHFWGLANPGASGSWSFNPGLDQNVEVSLIPVNASGVPKYRGPDEGIRATVIMQRITSAPVISQYGDATVDEVSVGIDAGEDRNYVRKIRVRYSDTLSGGALVSPTVVEFDYGDSSAPDAIDILRSGAFVSTFSWLGNDPATHGFTRTGSAPVDYNDPGWRINTVGADVATYYTKSSWPASPFAAGFTLDIAPPLVSSSDAAGVSLSAGVTIDDGSPEFGRVRAAAA